jgi:hypothetical protein
MSPAVTRQLDRLSRLSDRSMCNRHGRARPRKWKGTRTKCRAALSAELAAVRDARAPSEGGAIGFAIPATDEGGIPSAMQPDSVHGLQARK